MTGDVEGWATPVVRRELLTLLAYLESGSHKEAARMMAIAESTCRQRVSRLLARVGASNAAQATWWLRRELEAEVGADGRPDDPRRSAVTDPTVATGRGHRLV